MAKTIDLVANRKISLAEFNEYLINDVKIEGADSLIQIAQEFANLASDADLVSDYYNSIIKSYLNTSSVSAYTPQSIILGRGADYLIRANIWTPLVLGPSFRSQEERIYSYQNTHDHNFSFITIGYFGIGYETDLYRYDPRKVDGFIGEEVDLQFVERTSLPKGRIMIYEEKTDVHMQLPPESLSISLNVLHTSGRERTLDQYFFDPDARKIIGFADVASVHKRASVIEILGYIANPQTIEVLSTLMRRSQCRRVREASISAVSVSSCIAKSEKIKLISRCVDDVEEIVRNKARTTLFQVEEN